MQLYIDANVYLEYFRENSAERLTPLRELVKLVQTKKVRLLIPDQTKQEFFRNRRKIAELTRTALVQQSKTSFIIPATFDKNTAEIKDILKIFESLKISYKKLIEKYDRAVEKEKTDADLLVKKLFNDLGVCLRETDKVVQKAHARYMKGNPPRKNDCSYGDAITWETLLENGLNDNLVIISKDGDFIEKYKGEPVLNNFLAVEWIIKTKKKKRARLFKSLGEFVNHMNKRQIIKKEVVEKEENRLFYPNLNSLYNGIDYNSLLSPSANMLVSSQPFTVANIASSNFFTEDSLGSLVINNKASYCPYCGNRLLPSCKAITLGYTNEQVCSFCGKKIKTN